MKKTILLTSIGVTTGINVLNALKRQSEYEIRIVGTDINKYSPHLYLADKGYISPPIKDENRYLEFIFDLCEKEKIDMIIPLYSKEIVLFARMKDSFREKGVEIIISKPESVDLCNNKLKFYDFLKKEGFPFPKILNRNDILEIIEVQSKKVLIKDINSSGSKNVHVTDNIEFAIQNLQTPGKLVQEYITGKEYTCDLVANKSSKILGIVGRERVQIRNGLAICSITRDISQEMKLLQLLIKKLGIIGPANIQFIKKDDEIFIIEVNPRFAAGGLPLTIKAGVNLPLILMKYGLDGIEERITDYTKNLVMMRYYDEIYKKEEQLI